MPSRIAQLTIDVHDVELQSSFWSEALGLTPDLGDDGAATLYPPAAPRRHPRRRRAEG